MPPAGCCPALSNPQLWGGCPLPNGPHAEKTVRLLAQGPEMVHELLRLYTNRHTTYRSLPPSPRSTHDIQEAPGKPLCAVLPSENQSCHGSPAALSLEPLPLPPSQ